MGATPLAGSQAPRPWARRRKCWIGRPGTTRSGSTPARVAKPAGSNFVDHAGPLAAVVLMGNIAIRTGEKLYWDAEKLQFKNSEAANALLQPPYREGWSL